jgi:predicted enzyme related to lactoylglutathione lyase
MSDTFTGLGKVGQIAVNARDIDRATAFYRDVLGVKLLFPAPRMAFFQLGEVTLMLSLPEAAEYDHASSILYFLVDDIVATHATLAARGVAFRDTPHVVHRAGDRALWMTFFDDTEGNTLALQEWRAA